MGCLAMLLGLVLIGSRDGTVALIGFGLLLWGVFQDEDDRRRPRRRY